MKIRCLLGLHGPNWTADPQYLGDYSHREEAGFIRFCPHCKARWQGCVVDKHVGYGVRVMTFGPWTRVSK